MKERTTYEATDRGVKYALTMFSFDEFLAFWPHMERELDKIPHVWRHWTKEYMVAAVEANTLQVWGIGPPPNAVMVFCTQVATYPAMKVLIVPLAFGSFNPAMIPTIEAALVNYAQMNDCSEIVIQGRPGWAPHFKLVRMKHEASVWSYPVRQGRLNS